ncbi:MAG: tRNA pseudouridine(38-40) synthase TruA [Desulfobacteraceae bacterium 4572_35.1]|nr:MAG: tRNA pseudouridine(38-40) synthase TruA [Desulfobacteraceae bacterium 4572_35.1]
MARICLTIEYDGTDYGGWQVQPNAVTIQSCVEDALAQIVGIPLRIYSSGRTDAGVHALGMRAHFDVDNLLPLSAYREGLNRYLPADIAVRDAQLVAEDFHARFSARGKWYQYKIYRSRIRSPLCCRTAWQYGATLDMDKMIAVAKIFVGNHDFAAFRSSSCVANTTEREIYTCDIKEMGGMLLLDIRGSGFLKNMVRVIVGTLVDVGLGKISLQEIKELLSGGKRCDAGRTAPAHGLCLMDVWYEKKYVKCLTDC